MTSLRDSTARADIIGRVERLPAESQRKWGTMELTQMMAHAADQLRMALGDVPVEGAYGPFRFAPTRYLLVHVLPWPKGRAAAPREAFTTQPTALDADRAALVGLIERFASASDEDLAPLHPLFGPMSGRDWAVLSYRHLDHHLRQFGG